MPLLHFEDQTTPPSQQDPDHQIFVFVSPKTTSFPFPFPFPLFPLKCKPQTILTKQSSCSSSSLYHRCQTISAVDIFRPFVSVRRQSWEIVFLFVETRNLILNSNGRSVLGPSSMLMFRAMNPTTNPRFGKRRSQEGFVLALVSLHIYNPLLHHSV